jgi:hypothetical protein
MTSRAISGEALLRENKKGTRHANQPKQRTRRGRVTRAAIYSDDALGFGLD